MSWNGSDGSVAKTPIKKKVKTPSAMRGIFAGLVVVAIACGGLFYILSGSDDAKPDTTGKTRINDYKPSRSHRVSDTAAQTRPATSVDRVKADLSAQVKEYIKKAPTNSVSWKMPDLDPNDPDNALYTKVAQEIGAVISIEPGDPIPPFPFSYLLEDMEKEAAADGEGKSVADNGNANFMNSLKKWKIVAKETDDEGRLDKKQRLLEAQSELLAAMDEGASFNDTIRAAYEFRKNAHMMRSTIIQTLSELNTKDGDVDQTIKQIEDINTKLSEEGIKQIAIEEVLTDYETQEEQQ